MNAPYQLMEMKIQAVLNSLISDATNLLLVKIHIGPEKPPTVSKIWPYNSLK
jgi:hypothetical protein